MTRLLFTLIIDMSVYNLGQQSHTDRSHGHQSLNCPYNEV